MATTKTKTSKVQLTVTDVNVHANATTLEGFDGDVRLILMKDYDVFGDPTNDNVGDVHHFTLARITPAAKVPKPKPAPKSSTKAPRPGVVTKGKPTRRVICTGSSQKYSVRYHGKKLPCGHCMKQYQINSDGTMRQHYE